ncbi:MAG: hypothetical protein H0U50_03970 [Pyrinomonadaceae bacterium]|nr:hypothetical protein [Pyrinomonadaceae bacterium]
MRVEPPGAAAKTELRASSSAVSFSMRAKFLIYGGVISFVPVKICVS